MHIFILPLEGKDFVIQSTAHLKAVAVFLAQMLLVIDGMVNSNSMHAWYNVLLSRHVRRQYLAYHNC